MSNHNYWAGTERHSRHQSEHYHEFSGYGSTSASKLRDYPGWSPREPSEENPISNGRFIRSRQNSHEGKDLDREDRYYKDMSPGFDGIECLEQRNYSHTPRNDHHSLRYMGRGRSRSRSLSRSRDRSRSRSLSRGGRIWSRSRSRSDGNAKGRTRSWTPSRDYRHQSYGWSDRRGLSDKSSVVCWDFPTGNCRRGSQCRFLHPDGRDRSFTEDMSESFKRRADHERLPNHSYNSRDRGFDSRDDVLDPQFVKRFRSTVPCRNLLRGGCRWGDKCGFSHHFASDDGYGRNGSFEKDYQREANPRRMPLCKYFAAGRCARDDCRFSHDDVKLSDLGISHSEVTDTRDLHDKSRLWNVPTWDDSINFSPDDTLNRMNDDKWDHTMENNGKNWGLRGCTDNSVNRDRKPSPWRSSGHGREIIGTTESVAKHNMSNEQDHLMLHRSHLNDPRRGSSSHGGDIIGANESIAKSNMSDEQDHVLSHRSHLNDPHGGSSSHGGDIIGTNGSIAKGNMSDEQDHVILHRSQLNGGISNVQHQRKQENNNRTLSMNALQRDISQASHYQRRLENNEPTFSMNALQPEASHPNNQRRLENNVSTFSTHALQPDVPQASHYQRRLNHSESTFSTNSLQAEASHYQRRLENNDSEFSTNALQPEVSQTSHYYRRPENAEALFSTNASQQDVSLASRYQKKENMEPTFPMSSLQQDVSQAPLYQGRPESNMENSNKPSLSIRFSRENSNKNVESVFPGSSNETGKEQNNPIPNRSNGFSTDLNRLDTPTASPTGLQSQTQYHQEGVQVQQPSMLETPRYFFPRSLNAQTTNTPVMIASEPVAPLKNPTLCLMNDQSQSYPGKEVSNLRGGAALSLHPLVSAINAQLNAVNSMENSIDSNGLNNLGLTGIIEPSKQMQVECFSLPSLDMKLEPFMEHPQVKQQEVSGKPEVGESIVEEKRAPEIVYDGGKVEGSGAIKDEKGTRMFKNALADFVKEALKPKWREGKMSRDVHKTIVKKAVDKVINAIQADQVPKTQDKIDLYLSNSKTKISKLVQAYIDRCPKDMLNP